LKARRQVSDLDVTSTPDRDTETSLKKTLASKIVAGDSCFVVMPFGAPIGTYYQNIYEPAIQKAGLRAVRLMLTFLVQERSLTKFGQDK